MLCGLSRQTRNDGWCLLTVCCSLFYVYSDLVEGFPQMSCDVAEALCSTLGAILASVSPPGVSHLAPTKDWDVLVHSNTAVHLSTADGPVGAVGPPPGGVWMGHGDNLPDSQPFR